MKAFKKNFALLALALIALTGTPTKTLGQSIYTPYAFTNFAGLPGVSGANDGTGSAARFNQPLGLAVDNTGNVYVADFANYTVRKVTPAGVVTTLAGLPGVSGTNDGVGSDARFDNPFGVAVDIAGNVYVADTGNGTIRKVTPSGVVTTLAGLGGSAGTNDGTGSSARFNAPASLAVDSGGNVYVTDYVNYTVRKVTPAGVVTTLAGLPGLSGTNDGVGSDARFDHPFGVAVDSAGTVYVSDCGGNTIRKVTPAGVVTTLAGLGGIAGTNDGVGSDARFNSPHDVALDSAGNLYVADSGNDTIRKVTSSGAVTILAGLPGSPGTNDGVGSGAQFNYPSGVAVDNAGNVYVGDFFNNRITQGTPSVEVPHAAAATATVVNDFVVGATITDGGCGYTNTPTVRVIGGGGSGAQAVAVVTNGVVVSVNVVAAGAGYTDTPVIVIEPPFIPQPRIAITALFFGPSVTPVLQLDLASLAPYDNYQLQFTPAPGVAWTNLGAPFTPTADTDTQYANAVGRTGFLRVKYAP